MPASIKLDENLGRSHAELLRKAGYPVDSVHDEGLSGAVDSRVWERVCAEDRLLVTLDTDFSDIRRFPLGSHPGILLIRSKSNSRRAVLGILGRMLKERVFEGIRGCLAVADEVHTRIRRPERQED
jgi:predicted nuclease of predicted toxin-antitoxin system